MARKLEKKIDMGIHNRFDIEVIDAETGEVKQRAQAFNVICNNWWSRFFTETHTEDDKVNHIAYGSGSGTPSATDTTLFNYIALANADSSYGASESFNTSRMAEGIISRTIKRIILAGDAVGQNITEVGLTDSTNRILTHAILQDMNGNPISIAKTGSDIINIYGTMYLHFANTYDLSLQLLSDYMYGENDKSMVAIILKCTTLGYVQYTYPSWIDGFARTGKNDLYARLMVNTDRGVDNYEKSISRPVRDLTTKTATFSTFRFDTTYANMHGVGCITCGMSSSNSQDIVIRSGGTVIPPSRITGESVGTGDGTTTKFSTKMDNPYNATVYINGVQASGVTVKKKPSIKIYSSSSYDSSRAHLLPYLINVWPGTDLPTNKAVNAEYGCCAGTYINMASEVQISKVYTSGNSSLKIEGSNDNITWTTIYDNPSSSSNQHNITNSSKYKFIRFDKDIIIFMLSTAENDGYNIEFTTAPAQGDVITIDYTTDYIPKDEDHVLDISVTLSFGEYQGQ